MNAWTSLSIVSNENTAASSLPVRLSKDVARGLPGIDRALPIRMLPLMSTSTATLTGPFSSARKSTIAALPGLDDLEILLRQIGDETALPVPTTAATETRSTDERNRGGAIAVPRRLPRCAPPHGADNASDTLKDAREHHPPVMPPSHSKSLPSSKLLPFIV